MNISSPGLGSTMGGVYFNSSFSSLAVYENQSANASDNSLYGGVVEVAKPFIAFVARPLLEQVVQRAFSQFAAFIAGARDKASSLSKMTFQRFSPASAFSCYENILIQYPTADEKSLSTAQTICNNNDSQLLIYNSQLNSPGVEAIFQALTQNTVLRNLTFSNVFCDTSRFATVLVSALQTNPTLEALNLDLGDINPGPIIPSPMTSIAARTIFQKLACFNLSSLDMGFVELTSATAETFATTFQHTPYFPLSKLAFSWRINNDPLTSEINLVFQGLNNSRCLTEFRPATYTGLSGDKVVSLFEVIGGDQTVSLLNLWCPSSYVLNDTQKQAILDAVTANPCFLNYTNTVPGSTCFEPDLAAAIQNITQGRIPCEREAQCSTPPVNCTASKSNPDIPPIGSSSSGTTFTKTKTFLVIGGGVVVCVVGVTVFVVGKKKGWWCASSREIEPGAGPEESRVAEIQLPIQATHNTEPLGASLSPQPMEEGRAGEL